MLSSSNLYQENIAVQDSLSLTAMFLVKNYILNLLIFRWWSTGSVGCSWYCYLYLYRQQSAFMYLAWHQWILNKGLVLMLRYFIANLVVLICMCRQQWSHNFITSATRFEKNSKTSWNPFCFQIWIQLGSSHLDPQRQPACLCACAVLNPNHITW